MAQIEILYEDNHVLGVVKPQNVPSQADISGDKDMLTMVKEYIKEKYQKPGEVYAGLVQRLDRPVGGVMIFARTSKAAARLSKEISEHTAKKTYLAVLSGTLDKKSATLSDYIFKDAKGSAHVVPEGKKNAKYAELDYEVVDEKEGLTLVKVSLKTGRHHQIRVQFASRGVPIVGDQRYGKRANKADIALWCAEFIIKHPTKEENICLKCSPPNKFPFNLFHI